MTALITISDDKVFALTNRAFSYVMRRAQSGILEHVYYGPPLGSPLEIDTGRRNVERGCTVDYEGRPAVNLNETLQEFPCYGTSDYRYPAFHARSASGHSVFQFRYKSHRVTSDKPEIDGLPSARGGASETLIITLEDPYQNIEAQLSYTIYEAHGVLAKSVKVINKSAAAITLQNIFSSTLDLPAHDYTLLHLQGTWSREFNAERLDAAKGRFVIDSARGTSSAAHSPFLAALEKGASEHHGRVYATSLVYSGNFAMSAETSEFDDVRILAGLNPFDFEWHLNPGDSFSAPEALHVFSANGLGAMSHIWHDFVREKISPPHFKNAPRPSYLNSWESCYFDVDENKVLALADKANDIGVQMVVLDDGWFEGRKDATTSLGDWTADTIRFPSGIAALAAKIKSKGLKFGLWFEPEMVSPESALFKAHPDWALHVPERTASLGRNQLTLDLSRPEVCDYIFEKMDAILSCGDIDYVKWDMNRAMTEIGSAGRSDGRDGQNIAHHYMLGLYSVLSRLTAQYPHIIIENCASGGNRFDLGMLCYAAQNWTSDMCDPVGRLDIIHGASYVFPPDVMAAYIGPSPNHQNGRVSSLKTRYAAGAFCAAQGLSLSAVDLDADFDALRQYISLANACAKDRMGGRFDRVLKTQNETAWQLTTADKSKVSLAYFQILSAPNLPVRIVRLAGLDPQGVYRLRDDGASYRGDALMQAGFAMPYSLLGHPRSGVRYRDSGDFASHIFVFEKVSGS